ncbi:MAG: hypothetical protein N2749_01645 [Clostridia bacterium]|nr:hypothetical protein [Clostridia bacterium]
MLYFEYLLSDEEQGISEEDYNERRKIAAELESLPDSFFSKVRHFQPQIGCLNSCKICSKLAGTKTEYWTEKRQRNVIAAIKYETLKRNFEFPLIVWDRNEHRNGVIFSYLDNDIGNYFYLDKFLALVYNELGVKTRISTVGYSRYNKELNDMHKKINNTLIDTLAGVRLSFTPYAKGWCNDGSAQYSRHDYSKDIANFLSLYRPYYDRYGSGSRQMCVELRYKPLVKNCEVYDINVLEHTVICANNHMYISKNKSVNIYISKIADPYDHLIKLTETPIYFYEISLYESPRNKEEVQRIAHKFILKGLSKYKLSEVYMLCNSDGIYYSIGPRLTENGNYGINVYPKTSQRERPGYIITERFFLNAIFEYKRLFKIGSLDKFDSATWEDVYNVLELCRKHADNYLKVNNEEKSNYINLELLPMIDSYVDALQESGYSASLFFDPDFTIDTGIICNLGRALKEFEGLTYKENEPLTPNHERNYGSHNSTMTMEGYAWRLSCDYEDSIVIEKLNLSATSAENGQVEFRKKINLSKGNETLDTENLKYDYLIPGQRRK